MSEELETYAKQPAVIETASATTSPDNARSGVAAYLIFAAAALLLAALGSFVLGAARIVGRQALDQLDPYSHDYDAYPNDDWLNDYTDEQLEDLYLDLDEYINDMGRNTSES